ncbi:alpha/beta hydrolase [uncultured Thiothrix sp.]|uniref:alpha/beta fold hydrolase n=1 Tax=uncultured Thiothrix sp. TaxID=223185 RepID=UPI00262E4620|nr:alpha/beta hydrolase [uncultured Thiothrix sp.]
MPNTLLLKVSMWLASSLVIVTLTACSSLPTTPNTTIRINQSRIAYQYQPSQQAQLPTVVFQSGLGDDHTVWRAVLQGLNQQVATFSYDRPGYGASSQASSPRDPCQLAQEQHQLLKAVGVRPPYLLVGHSLGGLYEYVYATLYPEEVAGLVLLDPTHPQHLTRMQAEAPQAARMLSEATLLFTSTARQEFKAQQTCLHQLKPELAVNIPVRLLVSSKRSVLEQGAFAQLLAELAQDWQRKTHAPQIQAINSGHYIQTEQPQAVVAAIHELLTLKP